jgi:hypothetical protein
VGAFNGLARLGHLDLAGNAFVTFDLRVFESSDVNRLAVLDVWHEKGMRSLRWHGRHVDDDDNLERAAFFSAKNNAQHPMSLRINVNKLTVRFVLSELESKGLIQVTK